jgi:hypothetical protein
MAVAAVVEANNVFVVIGSKTAAKPYLITNNTPFFEPVCGMVIVYHLFIDSNGLHHCCTFCGANPSTLIANWCNFNLLPFGRGSALISSERKHCASWQHLDPSMVTIWLM